MNEIELPCPHCGRTVENCPSFSGDLSCDNCHELLWYLQYHNSRFLWPIRQDSAEVRWRISKQLINEENDSLAITEIALDLQELYSLNINDDDYLKITRLNELLRHLDTMVRDRNKTT